MQPTAAQLAEAPIAPLAVAEPGTELPRDFPTFVSDLAKSVTAGRRTRFEQAVALQQWFRVDGGFTYDLRSSTGNGTDDLVQFLTKGPNGRVGYCEQFAAAMAVLFTAPARAETEGAAGPNPDNVLVMPKTAGSLFGGGKTRFTRRHSFDAEALVFHDGTQGLPNARFVINYEN